MCHRIRKQQTPSTTATARPYAGSLLRATFGMAVAILLAMALLLGVFLVAGCSEPGKSPAVALSGGREASKAFDGTSSKNTALFGTIGAQPDATPPVRRLADVGERLNGAATTEDYRWAEAIAASEDAAAKARVQADRLAAENRALHDKLASAPSPEDFARQKERGDRVERELDAFGTATARAGIIGIVVVLAAAAAAWQFDRPRIFGWGLLASFSLNLEPYLIKRIAESPVLGYAIGALITAGASLGLYEAWRGRRENAGARASSPAVEPVAAPTTGETPVPQPVAAASWFARVWAAVRAWFAKVWAAVRARITAFAAKA